MQVNRLNHLLFPPVSPSVTGGVPDAADAEARDTAGATATTTASARALRAVPQEAPSPDLASVKLDLASSQRAQPPVTYGRDGIFAGKSSVEVANTPAERFVASAVEIMRTYQQEHAQMAAPSALDRMKQALMSRFSAQA